MNFVFLDELSFYQQELAMESGTFKHDPSLTYKLAESLNTHFILTAEPDDWEVINLDRNKEPEVKKWIAEAYAQGAVFIAPAEQWTVYSGNYTPTIDFTYIYNWISDNAMLFDEYDQTRAKVALIVSREATRKYVYRINTLTKALENANIAYDVIIGGDQFYDNNVSFETLNTYEKVFVQNDEYDWYVGNNASLKTNLDLLGNKLEKITTHDGNGQELTVNLNTIKTSLTALVTSSSDDINIYPREKTNDDESYVIHLVNQAIDNNHNFINQNNVSIYIENDYFGQIFTKATFYQPGEAPVELTISPNGNTTLLTGISSINFWGTVHLHTDVITTNNDSKSTSIVSAYPNPTYDLLHLPISSSYTITNLASEILLVGQGKSINVSKLAPGIYFLKTEKGTEKIVKL